MKNKILFIISIMLIASSITACDNITTNTEESSHSVLSYADTDGSPVVLTSSRPAEMDSSLGDESIADTSHQAQSDTSKADSKSPSEYLSSEAESQIVSSSVTSSTVETYTVYYHVSDQDDGGNFSSSNASSSEKETSSELNSGVVSDTDSDTDTNTSSSSQPNIEPVSYGSYTEDDIAFCYNGGVVHLGDDAQTALSMLGEPLASDSTIYNYSDFWVSLTDGESEDEQKVSEIQIFGGGVETEKGVKVGMKLDQVLEIYGESSTIVNGEYRYYVENEYMYIYLQNNIVLNIGYRIDSEVETPEE